MKRIDVTFQMRESGVIPLFYSPDESLCRDVITACYKGGMRVFEFTNRGAFAHEVFGSLSKWAAKELPDLALGAGTVVDAGTASLYIQLNAKFIVSPLLNPDMAAVCNRRKVLWIPGCATATEIGTAEELGADVVKLFPGSTTGGPAFLKNYLGPCPWSNIMPSGGVSPTEENLSTWFEAGAFCVGMGSQLITREILASGSFDKLQETSGNAVKFIRQLRSKQQS